jgi:hypothetical protein
MPPNLASIDSDELTMIRIVPQSSVLGDSARRLRYDMPLGRCMKTHLSDRNVRTSAIDVVVAIKACRIRMTVRVVLTSTRSHGFNRSFLRDEASADDVARATRMMATKPAEAIVRRTMWPKRPTTLLMD